MIVDDKRFKQVLLKTFEAFTDFCAEHHLKYYAAYGTLLGAIRHNGFIPWDDDIDVFMPREDYTRLKELMGGIKSDYEFIDVDTKGYFLNFAKFANKNTSLIEKPGEPVLGIYVDVFPLDNYDEENAGY